MKNKKLLCCVVRVLLFLVLITLNYKPVFAITIDNVKIDGNNIIFYWSGSDQGHDCLLIRNSVVHEAQSYCASPQTYQIEPDVDYTFTVRDRINPYDFVTVTSADTDNDGLPDWWEQKIIDADPNDAITILAEVLPDDDFDNDGLTNIQELQNGTDPTVPDSAILTVTPALHTVDNAGGEISIAIANTGLIDMVWSAAVEENAASWLTISSIATGTGSGEITVAYDTNDSDERVGVIIITSDQAMNAPQMIEVRQAKSDPTLEELIFEDDFNDSEINPGIWITSGNAVIEHDGFLDIQINQTDAGGSVKSIEFPEAEHIRLEVEHQMHSGGEYFYPGFSFDTTGPNGHFGVGWQRTNHAANYCNDIANYDKVKIAIVGNYCYAVSDLTSSDYYDQWIKSVIEYDSSTGLITLDIGDDGVIDLFATLPEDNRFPVKQLWISGYGWGTGHWHQINDIKLYRIKPLTAKLGVTPALREVSKSGGQTTFEITNLGQGMMNWTASVSEEANAWLEIVGDDTGINNGVLTVRCDPNDDDTRSGIITITSPNALKSPLFVEIIQRGSIFVSPPQPTTQDEVEVSVSWDLPTPCFNITSSHTQYGNDIIIDIIEEPFGELCAQVITAANIIEKVGKLAAGDYNVSVYINNQLFGNKTFNVSIPDHPAINISQHNTDLEHESRYDFGQLDDGEQSEPHSFTITNSGKAQLNIGTLMLNEVATHIRRDKCRAESRSAVRSNKTINNAGRLPALNRAHTCPALCGWPTKSMRLIFTFKMIPAPAVRLD